MIPVFGRRLRLTATAAAILFASSASSRSSAPRCAFAAPSRRMSGTSSFQPPAVPAETTAAVQGLEPACVWSHFATLSSIPRPSGQEEAVLSYIKHFANAHNLEWREDAAHNLCVFRPGSGGGENAAPVILQGHVDMVTEKNADCEHNFATDPIRLRQWKDNDHDDRTSTTTTTWIGARGTTLGADNGLGVAAALAILESEANRKLPPIQAVFTVDEETGLKGAAKLDVDALGLLNGATGSSSTMLNLDMEEWPNLYIGCAGGGDMTLTISLTRRDADPQNKDKIVQIRVEGLMGGHSGLNIHEGRANAILLCAAAAQSALQAVPAAALVSIGGGDKHNAIPREATATLMVPASEVSLLEESVRASSLAATAEFGLLEQGLRVYAQAVVDEDYDGSSSNNDESTTLPLPPPLDSTSTQRLLAALLALPHGPIKYSHALPGLVETSNNVAAVSIDNDAAKILCSSRSSIGTALEHTRGRIQAIAFLAGGTVDQSPAYPGWQPNPSSSILNLSKRLLKERLGHEPGVHAVHAGLECGLLIEKLSARGNKNSSNVIDAISFGPTIEGAHSPDERVHVETVAPFFELVEDILAELAEVKAGVE